jgi:hypothetical protein
MRKILVTAAVIGGFALASGGAMAQPGGASSGMSAPPNSQTGTSTAPGGAPSGTLQSSTVGNGTGMNGTGTTGTSSPTYKPSGAAPAANAETAPKTGTKP